MTLLEKQLFIKNSGLPGAGKGLFTKTPIGKGTRIIEYKGIVTTWKKVLAAEARTGFINTYLFYISGNRVINAMKTNGIAKYANDAKGFIRVKGMTNNSIYVVDRKRVFIHAIKDIPAGREIFVNMEANIGNY